MWVCTQTTDLTLDHACLPACLSTHILCRLLLLKENMPADVEKELSTKTGTVTPWWFAIKTLAKVTG